MIGFPFLIVGYFLKGCGLALVMAGDVFIAVGMWLLHLPRRVWRRFRKGRRNP